MATHPRLTERPEWIARRDGTVVEFEADQPSAHRLEEAYRASMPLPAHLEPRLSATLAYLLKYPGNMIRARMVYQMARSYGLSGRNAMDLAIALEYFHTASLVFDDLPCMDDATERRGAPCVHVEFGEAGALLAGLALINRAYALTWQSIVDCPKSARQHAMDYLEKRLGLGGLLNGQSLDLNYAMLPHDRETTERIACDKTVSLIRISLVLPALLGGAATREIQLLERLSYCWGLNYQIADDLKDVLHSSEESGKTAARDLTLDRPNIALAVGKEAAAERSTRLLHAGDRTLHRLVALRPRLGFLKKMRESLQGDLNRVMEKVRSAGSAARA